MNEGNESAPPFLDALLERLQGAESLDVEFKRAHGGVPKSLWPTVSAFANTNGGWIILGVREEDGVFRLEGVASPEVRLQEVSDLLRNPQKVSRPVCGPTDIGVQVIEGQPVLVLRVPAASRKDRPIYINGNPYQGTFVRRHGGDYLCGKQEVDRMMRDASDVAADSAILRGYSVEDLDSGTLAGFRRRFQTRDPGSPWNGYDDVRFLRAVGGFRRDRATGEEGITAAGLLMFGTPGALREWRSRHLIDYRLLGDDPSAGDRWHDRVAWDSNLLGAFEALYPRLVADQLVPFRLEDGARTDQSPVHVAVREALVNLLAHADYAETAASLVLRSPTGFLFRNPGSSRVPEEDLLSGDRSDPRNPVLVTMFRLIGLADEAGTGIPKIMQAWRELGFRMPAIETGTERYEFALELRYAHLLSEDDREWLRALGGDWTEAERMALVLARHEGAVDNLRLRRVTGLQPAAATRTLVGLRDRDLLRMPRGGRGAYYELGPAAGSDARAPQPAPEAPAGASLQDSEGSLQGSEGSLQGSEASLQDSEGSLQGSEASLRDSGTASRRERLHAELAEISRPARERGRLTPAERDRIVVALCSRAPLSRQELAGLLRRSESYVRETAGALVESGALSFLYPEHPNHPKQKYVAPPQVSPSA
jgi:ATP-dependent DNA helicase RecG